MTTKSLILSGISLLFQSLLCWILYYDQDDFGNESGVACFNPYYVGYCTMTPQVQNLQLEETKFQSLLCWILYYDCLRVAFVFVFATSFNPYYVGYCTMT